MKYLRLPKLRVLAGGVAMEQDHGATGIRPRYQPSLEGSATPTAKHVPLVEQPDVARCSPILRTRYSHAVDQDLNGLRNRELP
jgi:hypothetical protein